MKKRLSLIGGYEKHRDTSTSFVAVLLIALSMTLNVTLSAAKRSGVKSLIFCTRSAHFLYAKRSFFVREAKWSRFKVLQSLLILIIAVLLTSCGNEELGQAPITEDYLEQVAEWKQERVESISEPMGWLRLAGMFVLEEGENSFGSSSEVDIQFPEGTIDDRAGTFILENGIVTMRVEEGVEITHEGEPVTEITLYDGEWMGSVEHGTLEWFVIAREDITAIRLYNKENEKADSFSGFPAYPVDPKWARTARYIPNPYGTTIPIVNVLGQQIDAVSPGVLEFTLDGKSYTLDGIVNSTRLFIIIGDETNKDETYQAGRYLYVDYPEEGSEYTIIDFNKVYNPPCAYSKFTTCQLPPQQNRLDIAITAGEKRPIDWEGL